MKNKDVKAALPFILFYGLIYMSMATFTTYLNIYYQDAGYSKTQIGLLASIGPLVSLFLLPMWGILGDRTGKKRILFLTVGFSVVMVLMFPVSKVYLYICAVVLIYTSFNTAVAPLGDAITLQFIKNRPGIKFSAVRLVGTVSYAVMAVISGMLLAGDVSKIFYVNAGIMSIAFMLIRRMPSDDSPLRLPKEKREKTDVKLLFKNKMLVCIFLASFVMGVTMTFYHSFIGLLLVDIGAATTQVGIANAISAACEIPVLFIADRVFGKRKPVYVLMFVGLAMGVRMFLLYAGGSVMAVYASSLLHGFNYILPYYLTVVLLEKHAPEGLKATAQTVYTMFRASVASLAGNLGGGFLADVFDLRHVFLVLALMSFSLLFIVPGIGVLIYKWKWKK